MTSPSPADITAVRSWWADLRGDIPSEVRGLWFGIVDLEVDGSALRTLYAAGCPTFDAHDRHADWAADEYVWWPDGRYVHLPDFARLPDQPYQEVLQYAVRLIRELAPMPVADVVGAAVGFDDGDFELL